MDEKLQAHQQKAVQYWFTDGLVELSGGVICVVLSVYFIATELLPESKLGNLVLFAAVTVFAFGTRYLMQRIREKTTFPHTGFIALKSSWENRKLLLITIIFTLMLMLLMIFLIFTLPNTVVWSSAIGGVIMAFIFGMAVFETRLLRFAYLSIFCLLMGIGLAYTGLAGFLGAAVLSLVTGIILFAFGTVTRKVYLHQVRTNSEQTNES